MGKKSNKRLLLGMIASVALLVVAIVIAVFVHQPSSAPGKEVSNFETCKAAGGTVMESYPEQCRWEDRTFVNELQQAPSDTDDPYVGLTESEATKKAEAAGIPNRVVERDGESLPVTMDFIEGRINFHIEDGIVEGTHIEGEE